MALPRNGTMRMELVGHEEVRIVTSAPRAPVTPDPRDCKSRKPCSSQSVAKLGARVHPTLLRCFWCAVKNASDGRPSRDRVAEFGSASA